MQQQLIEDASQSQELPAPAPPAADEAVDIILAKLVAWGEAAIAHLPNLLLAAIVVVAFWIISRLAQRALSKGLARTPMAAPIRGLTTTLTRLAIFTLGLFLALGVLGLDRTVTSLLAGVGIVGLALGFAFQDMAANLMSGVILSFRRPINVGDLLETSDYFGIVEEINLRATIIRRPSGQLVYIPNKNVLENPIVNYTATGRRRVELEVGVSYGDDLDKVNEVAVKTIEGVGSRIVDEPVELYFEEFGGSSINLVVRFWIEFERQASYLAARSEAIVRLKKAFDENGITIPFPIRTLDFGIVGGQPLDAMLGPVVEGKGSAPSPTGAN